MKINKGIAVAVAALSIVGLAACGNSNAASGTTDTKADKGLDVIGNTITYDPNYRANLWKNKEDAIAQMKSSSSTGAGAARARILSTR